MIYVVLEFHNGYQVVSQVEDEEETPKVLLVFSTLTRVEQH